MASMHWTPDAIVGVDFGMTCTGVAYSIGPQWSDPRTIQKWPSKHDGELLNKVPTIIFYDTANKVKAWGAKVADTGDQEGCLARHFKLYIDPTYRPHANIPTAAEAQAYYKDYLSHVYEHIMRTFATSFPRTAQKKFEFLFSTPTTWSDPSLISELQRLILEAGFGSEPYHKITISTTEAEAAAIFASKEGYRKDDIVMVCDAGGGTTDVHIFKVLESDSGSTFLRPLTFVEGENVGSVFIDFQIEQSILGRLRSISAYLQAEPEEVAEKMLKEGRLERYKCLFNSAETLDLFLPIVNMQPGLHFDNLGIDDSKMIITRQEMRHAFDVQIGRMLTLIDQQLQRLQRDHGGEKVNFLVLSGGLGASQYVQDRFKFHFEKNAGSLPPNAHSIEVMLASEPQLAVVHGLVAGRVQELRGQTAVYTEYRARNSYGILCRLPYKRTKHLGEPVIKDPRDKIVWAERQIEWLIKQNEPVSRRDGITKPYRLKIDLGAERSPFRVFVVMSSLPPQHLPHSLQEEGARIICTLNIKLDPADLTSKNHRWYDAGVEHKIAEFTVKLMVESAELKFAVIGKSGRRMDEGHEAIRVEWLPMSAGLNAKSKKLQLNMTDAARLERSRT